MGKHLDEVFVRINGERTYRWRAVDADGTVLDILVQGRRDKAAARRFFRKLLKKTCAVPRVVITGKLRSYGAAHREVMPSVEHRSHKDLNNRAKNSHQPTRQRERAMKGFRSVGACKESTWRFGLLRGVFGWCEPAPPTTAANPPAGQRILAALQLEAPLPHRRLAHARSARDGPDPAMAQQPDLGGQRRPPLPLIQMRKQHPEPQGELITNLTRYAHTRPTRQSPQSNVLILYKPPAEPSGSWPHSAASHPTSGPIAI